MVTDSFTTTVCLHVQPQSVAGGALYLGLKHSGTTLPDDEEGRAWYDTLALDRKEMELVIDLLLSAYENPQLKGQAGTEIYTRDPDVMSFQNTRHISPSVDEERTPRDVGQSQSTIEPSQNGNGAVHVAKDAQEDQTMEDARSNGRSGSEEGELG